MNAAVKRFMRAGNGLAVFLYRRSNGRIGGAAGGGTRVLLLTVPGRKSGTPHTTPVSYFEDEGGYVVAGTAAGRKQDPQWFRNLRAAESIFIIDQPDPPALVRMRRSARTCRRSQGVDATLL